MRKWVKLTLWLLGTLFGVTLGLVTTQTRRCANSPVYGLFYSPAGPTMLVERQAGREVELWVGPGGRPERRFSFLIHAAGTYSGTFTPDGKTVLTSSADGTVAVWDVQSGALLHTLQAFNTLEDTEAFVRSDVTVAPDGKTVIIGGIIPGGWSGIATLWDIYSGVRLHTFPTEFSLAFGEYSPASVGFMATFTPDSKTLLLRDEYGATELWDVQSGAFLRRLTDDRVTSLRFTPDSKTVLTVGENVTLWDVQSGTPLRTPGGSTDEHTEAALAPDGKTMLISTATLWDVQTGALLRRLQGDPGWGANIEFAPDGKTVLTAGEDTILWDVQTGALLHTLASNTEPVISALFAPDGKTVLTGSHDGTAMLWDVQSGALLRRLQGEAGRVITFAPDGKTALTYNANYRRGSIATLWDVRSGTPLHHLIGHTHVVRSMALSSDGKTALTGSYDQTAILWDVQTGSALHVLNDLAADAMVNGVALSGNTALVASSDRTVTLWDVQSGALLRRLGENYSPVLAPDGKTVLVSPGDGTAQLQDVQSGALLYRLEGGIGFGFGLDGSIVITHDSDVVLWDARSGALVQRLPGLTGWLTGAAVSSDGRTLFAASDDGTAMLWDIRSGALLHSLAGHDSVLNSAVFAPDGKTVLASGFTNDGETAVTLWDVQTGALLRRLVEDIEEGLGPSPDGKTSIAWFWPGDYSPNIQLIRAALAPDGKTVLIARADGSVALWDMQSGTLKNSLCPLVFGETLAWVGLGLCVTSLITTLSFLHRCFRG